MKCVANDRREGRALTKAVTAKEFYPMAWRLEVDVVVAEHTWARCREGDMSRGGGSYRSHQRALGPAGKMFGHLDAGHQIECAIQDKRATQISLKYKHFLRTAPDPV